MRCGLLWAQGEWFNTLLPLGRRKDIANGYHKTLGISLTANLDAVENTIDDETMVLDLGTIDVSITFDLNMVSNNKWVFIATCEADGTFNLAVFTNDEVALKDIIF